MPRRFLKNRCNPCRARKIKCGGQRPQCSACLKSGRDCQWSTRTASSATAPSALPSLPTIKPQLSRYISVEPPEEALQDPQVARIFRHYIDHLAGWYDLNDAARHFQDEVPVRARTNPLLLSAILAFAAASQSSGETGLDLWELAEVYHLESVRRLLELTKTPTAFRTGETLAAICILRSYEIISQNLSCQNHLQGSYSLLVSGAVELRTGLFRAGFWNYLREDITVALTEKHGIMMDLSPPDLPESLSGDDDFANRVTYLLGRVINRCLREDAEPLSDEEWMSLKQKMDDWKQSLPDSFSPISTPDQKTEGGFPSLWTTSGWHVCIILWLAQPTSQHLNALHQIRRMSALEENLEDHARHVCAIAICSHSAPVWVNSFGPISFCWKWLRNSQERATLKLQVEQWGRKIGWPVSDLIRALSTAHPSPA